MYDILNEVKCGLTNSKNCRYVLFSGLTALTKFNPVNPLIFVNMVNHVILTVFINQSYEVIGTNNSEYDKFEFHCSEKGLTKSEQLRNLIQDFLNDMTQEQTKQPESIQA